MKRIVVLIVFLTAMFSFSQEIEKEDIKVGLVLSGGGAKGFAHVGVLKIIEEAGIRIDYIGGTSMGAIIGALYASGYNAKQLDSIIRTTDFEMLIQDNLPRSAKTFYEKDDSEKYAITLPFDNFQIKIPSALSKGQNVYNLLSKLTDHVSDIDDFNKLPIPFFCIATDIETGEMVLINSGNLPKAITASGAIPSLLSPVEINGRLLIDGGVVNNYPIDEVRAMGADIIIGVDVQDSLETRENLKSAFDILMQINNYRTIKDMKTKVAKTDVYLDPMIDDYSVISFSDVDKIIKSGVDKATIKFSELKKIAARQTNNVAPKGVKITTDSLWISSVEINGNKTYTRSYILGKLKIRTPLKTTYIKFNEGVNNMTATANFEHIDYHFINEGNSWKKLVIDVKESDSKLLLRLGVHYDKLFKSAALVNITRKRLISNNDVVSFDFIVGDNIRYNLDYYIDKGYYWSVGLNSHYNFFDKNVAVDFVYSEDNMPDDNELNQIELEYSDLTNQVFVQTLFKRSYLFGVGIEHKWLRYLSETIGIDENNNPRTIFEDTNYFSTYGFLKFDTYDNKFYPTKGFYFEGDFHLYLFANGINKDFEEFSIAKAKIGFAKTIFKKLSIVASTEGGVKIGSSSTNTLDFFLGGDGFKPVNNIISFYGYDALSFRGDTYLKASLTFDYEIFKNSHINISANIANVGDRLFTTNQWINEIDYTGYAIGCGWETFVGPIDLKYSYSPEREEGEFYVSVGFRF